MRPLNLFVFITAVAFPCFVTANARADESLRVTSHYFQSDPKSPTHYTELIKWPIINIGEWGKFVKGVADSPPDPKQQKFVPDGKTDVIHVVQRNNDLISGLDFYITPDHITKIEVKAVDSYYQTDPKFRDFMEKEMKQHFSFSEHADENVDENTPGITVMYNGSNTLKNPMWSVSEPKELASYISFIKKAQRLRPNEEAAEGRYGDYSDQDTFILYLNVPYAPARFVTLTKNGNLRYTLLDFKRTLLLDKLDFFNYFKIQAERTIDAKKYQDIDKAEQNKDKTKQF